VWGFGGEEEEEEEEEEEDGGKGTARSSDFVKRKKLQNRATTLVMCTL
jgi:hypothetical protein